MHSRVRTSPLIALLGSLSIVPIGATTALAQEQAPPAAATAEQPAAKIPDEQLDSLVAPIALYPDPLLAQVLAASTYPLEVVQLQQWLGQNKDLKDQALVDAVEKQDWDPSVQGLAATPDVVKLLANDVKWTTDLGNAFLAQQSDVMEAVQRMRKKAKDKGALKSDDKMKVETKTVESEKVIIIEQANPQVVYVPVYDPIVVYGPAPYPYPAYPPGYAVAGAMISFGVGVAVGAAFHGGWGYNCGWGGAHGNNVNINNNNTFVRNSNARGGNTVNRGGQWQHNPQHRGGAPYRDQGTANRYGGSTSREGQRAKQAPGGGNVGAGGGARQGGGERAGERGGGQQARAADRGGGGGGGDRVGDRSVSPSADRGAARSGDALGGGSHGSYSGRDARSSSARSSSSGGARSGGGGRGGGGGGARSGGGGRGGRR